MVNRRQFLRLLSLGVVVSTVDVEQLLWVPGKKTIFIPSEAQSAFITRTAQSKLWGIPYHQSNASMGTWLGIQREYNSINSAILEMVEKVKKNESD